MWTIVAVLWAHTVPTKVVFAASTIRLDAGKLVVARDISAAMGHAAPGSLGVWVLVAVHQFVLVDQTTAVNLATNVAKTQPLTIAAQREWCAATTTVVLRTLTIADQMANAAQLGR
jgi:hypothetical protein